MRILFLTQYFPPEIGAAQNRIAYFAKHFAAAGHDVTVLTSMPSYPRGEVFPEYRGKMILEEQWEGVRIVRVWAYVTKSKAFLRRLANYFSFVFASTFVGASRCARQDVIIVESPPLFLGLSGLLLKYVKRAKLAFNVSDLWPESAVAMGIVKNRFVVRIATFLEEFLYRHSDAITGQTRGIVQSIQERMHGKPVSLITNGTELAVQTPDVGDIAEGKQKLGWQESFVVGYTGVHGLAQGLETVIEAAALLAANPEIRFVLFGDGPDKEKLVALAEGRELKNVAFYPPQTRGRILEILSCLDVALVPLRRLELFRGALPSKLFEAMGAGVPVVVSVSGEAQELVEHARSGICVPPEDARAIADAILRLYQEPRLRVEMGANGKQYVLRNYNRTEIARNYEHLLQEMLQPTSLHLQPALEVSGGNSRREYPPAD